LFYSQLDFTTGILGCQPKLLIQRHLVMAGYQAGRS
jgi:hypothetical protein